jgi:hypothetical protein
MVVSISIESKAQTIGGVLMSEIFGSNVAAESTLRFTVADLYAAGKRLGPVEGATAPSKTTFEDPKPRCEDVLGQIDERKAGQTNTREVTVYLEFLTARRIESGQVRGGPLSC